MRYCTVSMIDDFPEWSDHSSLAEAEAFAADVAREGSPCRILALIREYPAGDEPGEGSSGYHPGCFPGCRPGYRPGYRRDTHPGQ